MATPLRAVGAEANLDRVEAPPPARALLELESGYGLPRGALIPVGGAAHPFAGWLELAAAIEEWRTASTGSSSSGPEHGLADRQHQDPGGQG